jgi:thiol:disulfide interchange protein DsbD
VLPMVPVTVAILGAGAQSGTRLRGFLLGSTYGLAMAVSYGALGIVVILTGAQFGVINSSPAFNILIAIVFAALALGMFDVIHIDFTRYRSGVRHDQRRRGNFAAAFFMGIIAALLAGACVAPAVISTVLYSATLYTNGVGAALLLPFLLGLGMALPWPFAGAGLSFLPKPGAWMNKVRTAFGVFIMAMALYYGYGGVRAVIESRVPAVDFSRQTEPDGIPWVHSLEQGLERAAAENQPVLIDFWATWCKNCLAMDATTMRNARVKEKLGGFVPVKFQAENPREKSIKETLDHFGVVGLPSYILMRKRE